MPLPTNIIVRQPEATAYKQLLDEGLEKLPASVAANRGIRERAEIKPALKTLPSPDLFSGIDDMVTALTKAIKDNAPIWIIGDYDVDGMTATTLAYSCLHKMNANVHWYIPNRLTQGYGLSPAIVDELAAYNAKYLLTVDNGISADTAILRAQSLGMQVLVTDHHQPNGALHADHTINPHLVKDNSEIANLSGVGVAFYLMAQLRKTLSITLDMNEYLDLVALGTIADCMKMDKTNRALTAAGLEQIRTGKARPAITALCKAIRIPLAAVSCRDISFRIAPRLNAAGRINQTQEAMACLLANDVKTASQQAQRLGEINQQRLYIQNETLAEANQLLDNKHAGIILANAGWHSGIVGIIAGKISDQYKKPAIIFFRNDDGSWRGSARAPAHYDIYQILCDIDKEHPDVLMHFGGHRQAAGITITGQAELDRFREYFYATCAEIETETPPLIVDAVETTDITTNAVQQLESFIWGVGFPAPQFAGTFTIRDAQSLYNGHLRLWLEDAHDSGFSAVQFNAPPPPSQKFTVLYRLGIDHHLKKPQIIIQSVLAAE